MEKASVGRFTVPSIVLLSLPASQNGALSLSSSTDVGKITPTGINRGTITAGSTSVKTVVYQ
jgi:hypothetical protein